jgi:phosphoglycerate dehydrogenase-like enzyme
MKELFRWMMAAVFILPLAVSAQTASMDQLVEELGLRESSVAARDMPGWQPPKKIVMLLWGKLPESGPGSREWLQKVAGDAELVFTDGRSVDTMAGADAYFGICSAAAIEAGQALRYIHVYMAGLDSCMRVEGLADRGLIATNSQKVASQTIAESAIALMLALTRNIHHYRDSQLDRKWARGDSTLPPPVSVNGKTMLVLGLGGIGTQTARHAHALGMNVIGTRNSSRSGPDFVEYVGLAEETNELAKRADVVVNALPFTESTRGAIGEKFFSNLRKGSYYISVGRGGTTDTEALMSALREGVLAGAGLDVTDPEPLPADHPLWGFDNVIITPHVAAHSDLSRRNTLLIAGENLRRYVAGEKLLNMVDLSRGY